MMNIEQNVPLLEVQFDGTGMVEVQPERVGEEETENLRDEDSVELDNAVSEPEPESQAEVFNQAKDYLTESEANEGKKKYKKKMFVKMRSSSRAHARVSKLNL
ncbi:hypothetical protein I3843_Q047600 [Carya illinoinensis]|nr:hypothetical protein I3843_Q047600 [Carya illinoinensis]